MDDYRGVFDLPLYQSRVFRDLKGWDRLEALGEHLFFPANHDIAAPGDKIKYCYLVVEGRVMSLEITEDGNEHIFNIFEPGSIFLESNVLADYPCAIYFRATEPTECVRVDNQCVRAAMLKDESIMQLIFESFASKYYSAMDQLRDRYNHDATWQVYNMLALLAESGGKPYYDDWVMIEMPMNQQFISNMLGVNRITVNRALKDLREKGLLMQINGKFYCIRQADAK